MNARTVPRRSEPLSTEENAMKRTLLSTSLLGALVTLGSGCPEEKKPEPAPTPAAASASKVPAGPGHV